MAEKFTPRFCHLSPSSPRLGENKFEKGRSELLPGLYREKNGWRLVLAYDVNLDYNFGNLLLSATEFLQLVESIDLYLLNDVDEQAYQTPSIMQRTPPNKRFEAIFRNWADPIGTYEFYRETIKLAIFNAVVNENSIFISDETIIAVSDGAGRVAAAQYSKSVGSNVLEEKFIAFFLDIDLGACIRCTGIEFLKLNSDGKRVGSSTEHAVRLGVLNNWGEKELNEIRADYFRPGNKFGPDLIVQDIYQTYQAGMLATAKNHGLTPEQLNIVERGSIFSLFSWRNEAGACKAPGAGSKDRSKWVSALRDQTVQKFLQAAVQSGNLDSRSIPEAVFLTGIAISEISPIAMEDALKVKPRYHINSTLSCKLVCMLAAKFWKKSLGDLTLLKSLILETFEGHYKTYGACLGENGQYFNTKLKKITGDTLYLHHKTLADPNFNSGQAATGTLLRTLSLQADRVLEG